MSAPATDRRLARHAATKARILDAAWALAREHGLAGISLRDLAAAVDLRQPSLYSYFESKNALYDAMFAQGYLQLLDAVAGIELVGDPEQQLRQMARRFVALIDSLYEMKAKLVASAATEPDGLCVDPKIPEFRRAASRLHEMQSAAYLETPHRERG